MIFYSKETAKIFRKYMCAEECSDLEQQSELTIKHYEILMKARKYCGLLAQSGSSVVDL